MAIIKINGRTKFFSRVQEVRKLRPGHYVVIADFATFYVEGGKPAGGSSRDWYLEQADGSNIYNGNFLRATSLQDALHMIENT